MMTFLANIPRVGQPIEQQGRAPTPAGHTKAHHTHGPDDHEARRGRQADVFQTVMERRNKEQVRQDYIAGASQFLQAIAWLLAAMVLVLLVMLAAVNFPPLISALATYFPSLSLGH